MVKMTKLKKKRKYLLIGHFGDQILLVSWENLELMSRCSVRLRNATTRNSFICINVKLMPVAYTNNRS